MSILTRFHVDLRVLLARDGEVVSVSKNLLVKNYQPDKLQMIRRDLIPSGVYEFPVLAAMYSVPRHKFMPREVREHAYADHPLPAWEGQTISQPYIVGLTTQLARVRRGMKVLDIGTGTGYQAAILGAMGAEVYSIEINEVLARTAKERLSRLHYDVEVRLGDGYLGWPEEAPFGAIVVAAASPKIPDSLIQQLVVGGRLVIPIGLPDAAQNLVVVERTPSGVEILVAESVRFVPMIGEAQKAVATTYLQ